MGERDNDTDGRNEQAWAALVASGTPESLAAGAVLVREGTPAGDLFAVVEGELIASSDREGRTIELGRILPGEIIGEVSLVVGTERSATVVAAADSTVVRVDRRAAADWFDRHPDFASRLVAQSRRRIDLRMVATAFSHLLGDEDVAAVSDLIGWRRLHPGEVLFQAGDPADEVFLIVSGRLVVELDDAGVRRRAMGRGETVGELGLLSGTPRSGLVKATRDSTVAVVSRDLILELVRRRPEIALHLTQTAISRTRTQRTVRSNVVLAVLALDESTTVVPGELAASLGDGVDVIHLDAVGVDATLGEADIAQAGSGHGGVPRLSEFLYDVEADHDVVMRSAGPDLDRWAERAVTDVDAVLLVADARLSSEGLGRIERALDFIEAHAPSDTRIWLVFRHPRWRRVPLGASRVRGRFGDRITEIHHLRADVDDDTGRLARLASGRGVGLVLGGGGARGFAHLGAWRAFMEVGLRADRIAGASIGAPLAAGLAQGVGLDEMTPLTERLFHRLLDYTVPVVALLKGERITASIQEAFDGWDVEDLWLPYFCVSSNLTAGQLAVHRRGDLPAAVRSSVSIPGVLPPVPLAGDLHVDGGVLDNLPVEPFVDDPSIGEVIAFDVAPTKGLRVHRDFGLHVAGWRALAASAPGRRSPYPTAPNVMLRSMMLGAVRRRNEMVEAGLVDLVVEMELSGVGLLDFERVSEVADAGYDAALGVLAEYAAAR